MPNLDFFAKLGLFVAKEFLSLEECRTLCDDIREAEHAPATIVTDGRSFVDTSIRSASAAKASGKISPLLTSRLAQLMPKIENHFSIPLTQIERPTYLRYGVGDYFSAHADVDVNPPESSSIPHRKISVILFLNDQSEEESKYTYSGGVLILYGVMNNPRGKHYGFPVDASHGQLIAFPSSTLHEVKPVTGGERFTLVTWFN